MKLIITVLAALTICALSETKKEPLKPKHLQSLMGIDSWSIDLGNENISFAYYSVEYIIEGKRIKLNDSGLRVLNGKFDLALVKSNERDYRIVAFGDGTTMDGKCEAFKKVFTNHFKVDASEVYSTVDANPDSIDGKQVVYRETFYLMSNPPSSMPTSDKKLGDILIKVYNKK